MAEETMIHRPQHPTTYKTRGIEGVREVVIPGTTRLDMYAAAALQGMVANPQVWAQINAVDGTSPTQLLAQIVLDAARATMQKVDHWELMVGRTKVAEQAAAAAPDQA